MNKTKPNFKRKSFCHIYHSSIYQLLFGESLLSKLAGMKEDFMKVRNLGRKGANEIIEKLKQYGIDIQA